MARFALVVLAGLGILGVFVPLHHGDSASLFDTATHAFVYQVAGGFGLAFLAGLLGGGFGIARWSALVAGIALGFVLSLFWGHLQVDLSDGGIGARLMSIGALGGIVAAAVAAAFPPKE